MRVPQAGAGAEAYEMSTEKIARERQRLSPILGRFGRETNYCTRWQRKMVVQKKERTKGRAGQF